MIKKLNRFFIVPFVFLMIVSLTSCSSYTALGLYTSITSNGYTVKFNMLDGRLEKKMLKTNVDTALYYDVMLESGEVNIYMQTPLDSEPVLICNLKEKEHLSGTFGYITTGHKAKIIIETVSKAKGEFNFSYSARVATWSWSAS